MQPEEETEAAAAAAAVSAVRRQELAASGTLKAATPTPQDKAHEMVERNEIHTDNKRKQKQALGADDRPTMPKKQRTLASFFQVSEVHVVALQPKSKKAKKTAAPRMLTGRGM